MEYYCLGPCPANEDAVQINANGTNALDAKKQAQQYAKLLRKLFPDHEKYGCTIAAHAQNHELGIYYEVVVRFEENATEITWDYAEFIEEFAPETWNDEAPRDFKKYCARRKNETHD